MTINGEKERTPAQVREDFRTDVKPSLFISNWGKDVAAQLGDKVKAPINAAVALAQLMASIRSGEPVDYNALDPEAIKGVSFIDGSDGERDHFFSVGLVPMFKGGSYAGPRVAAQFMSGYVNLDSSNGTNYARYDERWSTLRCDVIADRSTDLFDEDLRRLNNTLSVLEGTAEADLATERPESWPNQPSDVESISNALTALRIAETPIYVGDSPLDGVGTETDRKVHFPAIDGGGDVSSLPTPTNIGETLVLFGAVEARQAEM